ncbi:hypothetical protein PM082_011283 [Marasmius tenuissimus]|nr:hypothetical protein PM082_011283 [Marasmius tenuissimus]
MDKFRILNVDHREFKRLVEVLVSQVPDAVSAHPVRCDQRDRIEEREKNDELDRRAKARTEEAQRSLEVIRNRFKEFQEEAEAMKRQKDEWKENKRQRIEAFERRLEECRKDVQAPGIKIP